MSDPDDKTSRLSSPVLSAPLEEHLRSSIPPEDADRMWRSFKLREHAAPARRAARRKRIAMWGAASALTLAAAAAVVLLLLPAATAGPLVLEGGHALPDTLGTREGPSVFDLSDGSQIVLAPATEAVLVANTDTQIRARLERGSATFDVEPGGPRRWIIDAGEARVEVLGTRFTVTRRGDAVEVHVERGVVAVHHPSRGSVELRAGQSITVGEVETEPREEAPDVTVREPPQAAANAPSTAAEPAPASEAAVERSEARAEELWRARAGRGDFAGAYRVLGPGGLRASASGADAEELLLLADVARRSGHPAEAMPLYRRLLERSPDDVRAPVAAFSLGRLQLDRSPDAAADSFAFVRGHRAGSALAEDATALEASAASRAGRVERAERVARIYLERFPDGRRADSMRRLLER